MPAAAKSYRIYSYQRDSAESIEVLPRIRQILLNQRHAIPGYDIHAEREHSLLKPVGEPVFVKRIIPHGYSTGKYEYDSKLKTIFKPLARYHVKKPIEEHEKSILKDLESEQKQPEHTGKNLIILVQKKQEQQDLLRQIQKLLIHNTKQMNREKAKARIRGLVQELGKNSLLMLREKSGEEHDPFLPPHIANQIQQPKSEEEEDPKVIYPSYPFWNYWTYHKTLYQDRCPGDLIKVGNMCISSVGHRRSSQPFETRRRSSKKRRHSIRKSRQRHLYGRKK